MNLIKKRRIGADLQIHEKQLIFVIYRYDKELQNLRNYLP